MNTKLLFFIGLFLPIILVFKAFFLSGPLVFGDAPYFFSEFLIEWIRQPFSWINFGNTLGGVNVFLWLYPLMFIYGSLHTLFGLGNDLIIRIVFYFPAVILSVVSPILLARYLGYGKTIQFFTSVVYTFNTYFILLIDGGQVGIALAYGIFPLTLLYLKKLRDKNSYVNFLNATTSSFLLTMADPRIALICFGSFFTWRVMEASLNKENVLHNLKVFIPLGLILLGLNCYWVIPTLLLGSNLNLESTNLSKLTLLNPFLLFQPHWPQNEFGKVSLPPIYFVGIPILLVGGLVFNRSKKYLAVFFSFLVVAFLAKGDSLPFGQIYGFFTTNIPFGGAFRDATKFFIPLMLFAGLLVGMVLDNLPRKFKLTALIMVYAYLLFLIHPAILGQLNGTLKNRSLNSDFLLVEGRLKGQNDFFRTAWFPERSPFSYHTEKRPALDTKNLVWERPFTSLNVGTFDHFNFLHRDESLELFKLLGIKYWFLSGDPRKSQLNEEEKEDWDNLLTFISENPGLTKEDWGLNFPVYSLSDTKPRIFGINQLILVLGGDNVYQKYSPNEYALIFLEDGKTDVERLENIASSSAVLLFNDKESIDLTMTFLEDYFLEIEKNTSTEWAVRQSNQYLHWKYEFLNRGIETSEFDFGKGIAFSDQKNEEIAFNLSAKKNGDYILAVRSMAPLIGDDLLITFNGESFKDNHKKLGRFEWFIKEVVLTKSEYNITFENLEGMSVLNTVALIPKEEFEKAKRDGETFINKFSGQVTSNWQPVEYFEVSPVEYKVEIPSMVNWLVFTDSYHDQWLGSYPFYSMVNGFYVEPNTTQISVKFNGQFYVKIGFLVSILFMALLAALFLWGYSRRR